MLIFKGNVLENVNVLISKKTCLFLSPVLIFEFLAEKIGFLGRENLFLGLHRLSVENHDSVYRVALVGGLGGLSPPNSKKTVCRGGWGGS